MEKQAVLIPLAEGFEEIEVIAVIDLLRRAGVEVTTANLAGGEVVTGAHGIAVRADKRLEDVKGKTFSAVILPGGMPGTTNLLENRMVGELVREHAERGAYVAAICAAPTVLAHHGLLKDRRATCYPGCETMLTGARFEESAVVEDGRIVTSRGPGTALPFALRMIEKLCGPEKANEIKKQTLA